MLRDPLIGPPPLTTEFRAFPIPVDSIHLHPRTRVLRKEETLPRVTRTSSSIIDFFGVETGVSSSSLETVSFF